MMVLNPQKEPDAWKDRYEQVAILSGSRPSEERNRIEYSVPQKAA